MNCCSDTTTKQAQPAQQETLLLEFLYLDESVCKPCGGTGIAVDKAAEIVASPLSAMGMSLEVERLHVANRADAIRHQLDASPTIRINGTDIDPDQTQDDCETCGEIAGGQTKVDCRTWHWKGETHSSAPVGLIVEAIMRAALTKKQGSQDCGCDAPAMEAFVLSENLEKFFEGRESGDPNLC